MNVDNLIYKFCQSDKPVLYIGAGVSCSPPSSIPTFNKLMEAYFDAINEKDGFLLRRHVRSEKEYLFLKKKICELPIEEFFSDIKCAFGERVFDSLDWMDNREPNQAHKILAKLANNLDIRTILTPNFDCLLEKLLPDFHTINEMKFFSIERKVKDAGTILKVGEKLNSYINFTKKVIFHLHGSSIKLRLDITPSGSFTPFDHFDHANLAPRLDNSFLLFAGCSGNYDYDVKEVLSLCNIKRAIWIIHDRSSPITIDNSSFPQSWKYVFNEECYAIRGNTTEILSKFTKDYYVKDKIRSSDFRDYVINYFRFVNIKSKLYFLAVLLNQLLAYKIDCGDVALSVIDELDECYNKDKLSENEMFLSSDTSIILSNDAITINGKTMAVKDYKVVRDFHEARWPLMIGRARAITLSRHSQPDKRKNKSDALKRCVINKLEEIISSDRINIEKGGVYKLLAREWLLAYESMGVFYLEDGEIENAIENFDKALLICSNEEDQFRLIQTRFKAINQLCIESILSEDECKLVHAFLSNNCMSKESELLEIVRKIYAAGAFGKAEGLFSEYIKKFPNNIEACLDYSNLLKSSGKYKAATDELQRCLDNGLEDYRVLCNLGLLCNETGKFKDAFPLLTKALKINPKDELSWNNLGESHYFSGDFNLALKAYDKAISLRSDFPEAIKNRKKTLMILEREQN